MTMNPAQIYFFISDKEFFIHPQIEGNSELEKKPKNQPTDVKNR